MLWKMLPAFNIGGQLEQLIASVYLDHLSIVLYRAQEIVLRRLQSG